MNEILTYKQAMPYIRKVKTYLRAMSSMEFYIKNPINNTTLVNTQNTLTQVKLAFNSIENKTIQDVIEYCFIHNHTSAEAAKKFSYSFSSICRFKRNGLSKIAKSLFGVIIQPIEERVKT